MYNMSYHALSADFHSLTPVSLEPLYDFFTGLLGGGFFRGADATTLSPTKLCPAN